MRKFSKTTQKLAEACLSEGQVSLQRFTTKERRAIVKARNKAKKVHKKSFWGLYCNGVFPRRQNCHRNSQIMTMYSGLRLTYNEGWVLYRYGTQTDECTICYHAWNEYEDGRVLDTTWDFEFYPITQMRLGNPANSGQIVKAHYEAGCISLFHRTPPTDEDDRLKVIEGFIKFHGENFIFSQNEALMEGYVHNESDPEEHALMMTERVMKCFNRHIELDGLTYDDAKRVLSIMVDLDTDHMKHLIMERAVVMSLLMEHGYVKTSCSPDSSDRLKEAIAMMNDGNVSNMVSMVMNKLEGGVANMV